MSTIHENAGQPVRANQLVNIPNLVSLYYLNKPDLTEETQRVRFGTSGHRGTSLTSTFTESHILAMTQAICDYRRAQGYTGWLYMGMDTHALSDPAHKTALEVLAANNVNTRIAGTGQFTPTPVISHAILGANRAQSSHPSDGIVITPSHNPPDNGGFKYNPPEGGPAGTEVTLWIAERANALLENRLCDVKRNSYTQVFEKDCIKIHDYITPYVNDLGNIIDMEAIRDANLKLCADAMGGAGLAYWQVIARTYGLDITTRNAVYDPTFRFMTYDWDGKIRMDCSSSYVMASLVNILADGYDLAFGNDPDFDRHGIVTRSTGLMNANHYLAVAIEYLFTHRPQWSATAAIGKTLVSSSMIDKVANKLGRTLKEVPVGFKWFVDGLLDGSIGFGGEESAGASFLRKDGSVWTTDKDGFILCLLAAEILAVTGKDPGAHYQALVQEFGAPLYQRQDAPATLEQKAKIQALAPEDVTATTLAGEPILAKLTQAPGNRMPIGGLKVCTESGWFAARPSGTEEIYKIYAESFKSAESMGQIFVEARQLISEALSS
ncbi:phosphoglucomutase (alpha-D-glucose-1,6-bisphosphate-dependent) [Planctomycetota bacterium]